MNDESNEYPPAWEYPQTGDLQAWFDPQEDDPGYDLIVEIVEACSK